jgi:hypothetical protein
MCLYLFITLFKYAPYLEQDQGVGHIIQEPR